MSALPLNDRLSPNTGAAYEADADQTDFAGDFPLLRDSTGAIIGLYVIRQRAGVPSLLAYPADLDVTGETDDGFTARLDDPCEAGDLVWVWSNLPAARDRAHAPGGSLRTDTLEGDADSLQAQVQELRRDLERALKLPFGEALPADLAPRSLRTGGLVLGFDIDTGAIKLVSGSTWPYLAEAPADHVAIPMYFDTTLGYPRIWLDFDNAWHGFLLS